jgi:hypothetical protein
MKLKFNDGQVKIHIILQSKKKKKKIQQCHVIGFGWKSLIQAIFVWLIFHRGQLVWHKGGTLSLEDHHIGDERLSHFWSEI